MQGTKSTINLKFINLKFIDTRFIDLKFIDTRFINLKSIDTRFIDLKFIDKICRLKNHRHKIYRFDIRFIKPKKHLSGKK